MKEFEAIKYSSKEWAIYSKSAECYVLFGTEAEMKKRADELNKTE